MPTEICIEVLTIEELGPAIKKHFGSLRPFASGTAFPDEPGIYVWSSGDRVMYIGMSGSLAERLGYEQGEVDAFNPATHWHYSVFHMLKLHAATVCWLVTADKADASLLERRLIEWHRACVGTAPLVVGWEAKDDGKPHGRFAAEQWARTLWTEEFGGQAG